MRAREFLVASVLALADLGRAVLAVPVVEWCRRSYGPSRSLSMLRRSGCRRVRRTPGARGALQRRIPAVDACFPGGRNCYRRVLLEVALDSGAAAETVHLGLRVGGGPGSGHAWLASWPDAANAGAYDVVVEV